MGQQRATRPPRRRFFLGCEGQSELGYGALLQRLADDVPQLRIHIELHDLRGGDPLSIVQGAIARRARQIRSRGAFEGSALLLDADRRGEEPERDAQIEPLAQQNNLLLIWQRPCHEALLLHHLPNCQSLAPQNSSAAHFHLRRVWSVYQKPMSARQLRTRIGLAELLQAAMVESELAALLSSLGFL